MNRELKKYLDLLDQNSERLKEDFFVKEIGIFGSTVHGTLTDKSDIDVLVAFSRPVGFFHFIRLNRFLRRTLKRKVDLATEAALKPLIRDEILNDVVYA